MKSWILLLPLVSFGCAASSSVPAPPGARKPLAFQAVRETDASPDPEIELGACGVAIAPGDVLEYELYAADAHAERAGVELVLDDGTVIAPPQVGSSGARVGTDVALQSSSRERGPRAIDAHSPTGEGAAWARQRIPLDDQRGKKIAHVVLAARNAERGACTFYVDDLSIQRTGGAAVALADRVELGERREQGHDGCRAACFAVDYAPRYPARFVPAGARAIGDPWALLDLSTWRRARRERAASGDAAEAEYAGTIYLDAGVPFRFAAPGEERAFAAAGQRVFLTALEGGRYYDLHVALAADGDAPVDTSWLVLGRGGATRRLAIRVMPQRDAPAALGAPFTTACVPVAAGFEIVGFRLPDDARVHVYAATARWRKDAPGDATFRRRWLAREMPGEDLERYLRDVEIGALFAARAGFAELEHEAASERALFDLGLRGDAAGFRALLGTRLTAFDRASAAFKRDHVAFCVRTDDGAGSPWTAARESCARALRRALDATRAGSGAVCSVPSMQACEWLAQLDADAFDALKQLAIERRVDVPAGSWTHDPASGGSEAMVRQLLLARSFTRGRFSADLDASPVLACAPRDLSYARQLPQLCRSAGVEMLTGGDRREAGGRPALFEWTGPDGSRLVAATWRDLRARRATDIRPEDVSALLARTGKGGVRVDVLVAVDADEVGEVSRAIERLSNTDLAPSVSLATPSSWLELVRRDVASPFVPWDGTHENGSPRAAIEPPARIRTEVRRAEASLGRAEGYAALASGDGLVYLHDEFVDAWKRLIWCQGFERGDARAVSAVLEDAREVGSRAQDLSRGELAVLARAASTKGPGQPIVVFNPLPWDRTAPVEVADADVSVLDPDLHAIPSQRTSAGKRVFLAALPSFGYAVYHLVASTASEPARDLAVAAGDPIVLANDALRVAIDSKSGRVSHMELAASGVPLVAHDGIGGAAPVVLRESEGATAEHSARFVDAPDSVRLLERGPVRSVVRVERTIDPGAKLAQDFVLYAQGSELAIRTRVDGWRGPGRLYSVFQLAHASPWIVHGVPFGSAALPSGTRDRWSDIRALDWIAQGDSRASMVILDDADAAFTAGGKSLAIQLDDGVADLAGVAGRELELVVHAGAQSWRAGAAHAAAELEHPPQVVRAEPHEGTRGTRHSFLRIARLLPDGHAVEGPRSGVMLSALKPAESGDDWIVRVYELNGDSVPLRLTFDRPVFDARTTDVLERPGAGLRVNGKQVELKLAPYRIETIRVSVKPR